MLFNQQKTKKVTIGVVILVIITLIVSSLLQKINGEQWASENMYGSVWFITLWAVLAFLMMATFARFNKKSFTFLLHVSFVFILLGALITHWFGVQGTIRLHENVKQNICITPKDSVPLPFSVALQKFDTEYYPGTSAHLDYITTFDIFPTAGEKVLGQVSMNRIFEYAHYRFYQHSFDGREVTLAISYDPWGIGITYFGYALLFLSMLGFFLQKRSYFKVLFAKIQKPLSVVLLLGSWLSVQATELPRVPERAVASQFGNLYVYHNERVCPLRTMANDVCLKVYGKSDFHGLTEEQVIMGWLLYYDSWKKTPFIKVKGKNVREALGIDGKYASLNDFYDQNGYKLKHLLEQRDKNAIATDEKVQLISMVATGTLFRIWAVEEHKTLRWYSWVENSPPDLAFEDWQFRTQIIPHIAMLLDEQKNTTAFETIGKMRAYQRKSVSVDQLPSEKKFNAERAFVRIHYTRPLAMGNMLFGIFLFAVFVLLWSKERPLSKRAFWGIIVLLCLQWLFLTAMLALRWYISGHLPLSNGHETMQFLAWVTFLLTICISMYRGHSPHSLHLQLPFGVLIAALSLMVSMMTASNPQLTNLMPVLQSPLLSIHVAIIMLAYSLLAFIMLNSVLGLCMPTLRERLMVISQIMLYPAVFALTMGIFIGAIWANISWGRYWGWDPKETWALITMLIYALPLHTQHLKFFQNPKHFHIYCLLAFFSVLITYFGVNFLLGGMHSYA